MVHLDDGECKRVEPGYLSHDDRDQYSTSTQAGPSEVND